MLIECKHCGAPLDVQTGARITKCKYCGTTSRVKAMKTVAEITPAGWRPPVQWQPPPSMPADSGKTLVYHATWAVRRLVRTVVTIVAMVVLLPLIAVIVMTVLERQQDTPEVARALAVAREAIEGARQQIATATQAAGTFGGNLREQGPDRVVELLRKAVGGDKVHARRLVIHPGHATLVAQDPSLPDHLDEYSLRGSVLGAKEPYRPTGLEQRGVEAYLFDLDDVAIDKIPSLAEATVEELGYDQGAVSHVIIERNLPFGKDIVIRVYVSSPRDTGRIDYDATGKVQKVYR